MPKSRIPSPARSQGEIATPRRKKPRRSHSVCSPARSTASGRLSSLIDQFKEKRMESFVLSPPNGRSVLNDNTDIEEPRRKSWWKHLNENSQDIMEVLEDNKVTDANNEIEEFIDIEVLSLEKNKLILDLPESSDNESIHSIVLPQRRLFSQKENQAQKKFGQIVGKRETLAKLHKTNTDKTINVETRELFQNTKRSKPVFPAALLIMSPDKTIADKTKENVIVETKPQVRNIFGKRPSNKRKNMFADFLVSESEDEIPDIQPKVFGFQKKLEQRRISSVSKGRDPSPSSSITADMEMDEWKLLPSSTMVENQLEDMVAGQTPIKRARLSKLSEAKESEAGTLQTNKSVSSNNKSKSSLGIKEKTLDNSRTTRSMLRNVTMLEERNSKTAHFKTTSLINNLDESPSKSEATPKQNSTLKKSNKLNKSKTKNSSKLTHSEMNESVKSIGSVDDINNQTRIQNKSTSRKLSMTSVSNKNVNGENIEIDDNPNTDLNTKTQVDSEINEQNDKEGDDEMNFTLEYEHDEIVMVEEVKIHNESPTNHEESIGNKKSINDSIINQSKSNKTNPTNKSLHQLQPDKNVKESIIPQPCHKHSEQNKVYNHLELESETMNNEVIENHKESLINVEETPENQEMPEKDTGEENAINKNRDDEGETNKSVKDKAENEVRRVEADDAAVHNQGVEDENDADEENNEVVEAEEDADESNVNKDITNQTQDHEDTANDSQEDENYEAAVSEVEAAESEAEAAENEAEAAESDAEAAENEAKAAESDAEAAENGAEAAENEAGAAVSDAEAAESEAEAAESEAEAAESEAEAAENEAEADESEAEAAENEAEATENEAEATESEAEAAESEAEAAESEAEAAESEAEADESEAEAAENEAEATESEAEAAESEAEAAESEAEDSESEVDGDQQSDNRDKAEKSITNNTEIFEQDDNEADEMDFDDSENNENVDQRKQSQDIQIEEQSEGEPSDDEIEESPNVTHDTTGRNRKKEHSNKSPEVILHDKTNQMDSFAIKGRNTSVRKTKSMIKNLNIRPSLAPHRDSTGFSDGTKNSSAEGSGWDSHRTTRKTLRQTFGKDFTPRKSLRALVMEKSAKRQTEHMEVHSESVRFPQANSTELPEVSNRHVEDMEESDQELSRRTRQATLETYLLKIKQQNIEKKIKLEEAVRNSLKASPRDTLNIFKVPNKPAPRCPKPTQSKPKKNIRSVIPFDLPSEIIEDMKYKPPKRFQPRNVSWITKRLYKYLENKLEPKYDYKARVRAEKLVETIYHFAKDLRRYHVAPTDAVEVLKHEFARLDIVNTHFEFYEFFHEFMPREIRIKVIPDIVNEIPLPRHGIFSDILLGNTVQG